MKKSLIIIIITALLLINLVSAVTVSHGVAMPNYDTGNLVRGGMRVTMNVSKLITYVCVPAVSNVSIMYLRNSTTIIKNATITNYCANMNYITTVGEVLRFEANNTASPHDRYYSNLGAMPVVSSPYLTWNAFSLDGVDDASNRAYQIQNITLEEPSSITFQGQTPTNASNSYYLDTFQINTSTILGGTTNTTHNLYNSSSSIINTSTSTSINYLTNYTGLTPGIYYYNATANNGTSNSSTETRQINITYWNAQLNLSLKNGFNGSLLGNASINITDLNTSRITNYNTTTGQILAYIVKNNTNNIYIDAPGYALTDYNYTANTSTTQYLNLSIYTNNSVRINIYDEATGTLITQNISVILTSTTEYTDSTTNGTLYKDNLIDGNYTVKFQGTNYSLTQYALTIASRSTQVLNAFLSANSSQVTFTIMDYDSAALITGATFTQSRLINGTWTVIQSKTSDITGRVQVNYLPSVNYQFIVSATGYETQIFYLNPVIFSTYNVRLEKTTSLTPQNTPDNQGLSIDFSPTKFYNNASNTFYWVISSPSGALTTYTLNLTYPGGNSTDNGVNAYGESFTKTFNITNANTSSQVIVTYCYDTTTTTEKCFKYKYGIIGAYSNQSFLGANENQASKYNMGALDSVLIATVITLAVSGLAFSVGGLLAGLPIALLLLGMFYYIGFISLWGILPSMLIGLFIIFGRTEGG